MVLFTWKEQNLFCTVAEEMETRKEKLNSEYLVTIEGWKKLKLHTFLLQNILTRHHSGYPNIDLRLILNHILQK